MIDATLRQAIDIVARFASQWPVTALGFATFLNSISARHSQQSPRNLLVAAHVQAIAEMDMPGKQITECLPPKVVINEAEKLVTVAFPAFYGSKYGA